MSKVKALTPIEDLRNNLTKMDGQFKMALPAHIPSEKFTRVLVTAIQLNSNLLLCTRQSLYSAAMLAAQDGLFPDGRDGAIIPFKTEAKWMPMIGGILKKFRNSGECSSISCHVVYENDEFSYWTDELGEHIKHVPGLSEDRGEMMLAYAIARVKDGGIYIEVMNKEAIEKIRNVSRSKDNGPWKTWPEEMWRKTVLRRLSKKLPMSTDLEQVIERDNDLYEMKNVSETKPPKTKSSRLEKIALEAEESPLEKELITKALHEQQKAQQDGLPAFEEFGDQHDS